MATTYYASVTSDVRTMKDVDNAGVASTATDILEIRMGNGTYLPSREEVLLFCEKIERWVIQGGLDQAGANLPIPASGTHG
jgi:hypothetical protein